MSSERLQKIIARAGYASRRKAEEMIRSGRVTVNGRVVTELGTRADSENDHVKVDGKLISRREQPRYILLYKPKEVMTTVSDPEGRTTVLDFIRGVKERIFPVGRLDFHSEGLIILTNDGELAFKIAHPTSGSVKTYHVKVRGVPEQRLIDKLQRGITIEGKRTLPCEIQQLRTTSKKDEEGNSWFEVKLREGRTQQIRKMFKAVGHPVAKLKRVAIGNFSDPSLKAGQWRELTPSDLRLLTAPEKKPRKPPAPRAPKKKTDTAAKASSRKSTKAGPAGAKRRVARSAATESSPKPQRTRRR